MSVFRIGLLMLTLCAATSSFSQEIVRSANTRVGTVQTLDQGESLIVISGRQLGYDDQLLTVFFDGAAVDSIILEVGMVVRYIINSDSVVVQMELLGPIDKIRAYFEH